MKTMSFQIVIALSALAFGVAGCAVDPVETGQQESDGDENDGDENVAEASQAKMSQGGGTPCERGCYYSYAGCVNRHIGDSTAQGDCTATYGDCLDYCHDNNL